MNITTMWLTCLDLVHSDVRQYALHTMVLNAQLHILQPVDGFGPQPLQSVQGVLQTHNGRLEVALGASCCHLKQSWR